MVLVHILAPLLGGLLVASGPQLEGTPPSEMGNQLELLKQAIAAGDEADVERLLLPGDINIAGRPPAPLWAPPLHHAVITGSESMTRLILKHGADVNDRDDVVGATALHVAAKAGNLDLVRLLLHHGADMLAKDSVGGNTPLHGAAAIGHVKMISLLLDVGGSVETRADADGATPLHVAARGKHEKAAERLMRLSSPEAIHAKDSSGSTALDHWPELRRVNGFRELHEGSGGGRDMEL